MKKYMIMFQMLIITALSYALNFTVYPTRFLVPIDRTTTQELKIINNTEEPLRVEMFAESDKEFGEEFNLNSNIKIFPNIISIKPGESQIVRFRVKPNEKLNDGEYKSYLTFKEVPYEVKNNEVEKNKKISSNLKFNTEISIPISSLNEVSSNVMGKVENIIYNYNGTDLNIKCTTISKGNTALQIFYILTIDGLPTIKGKIGYSKREGEKDLDVGVVLPAEVKGKKANLKIFDQTGKEYYNKKISL